MKVREKEIFTTIHSEGGLLPSDLLERLSEPKSTLEGLDPETFHLEPGETLNQAINRSWNRLTAAWANFSALRKENGTSSRTTLTRERWLLVLFRELGYGRLAAEKALEFEGKSYPISHGYHHTPIHLVGYQFDLDIKTKGAVGAARSSPHSLVQELLNRSEEHLWGFVSNGLCLRVLRDNVSLTRMAFLEFDLEALMEGEIYSDFVILWLVCHQSRVEAERAEDCWLERWTSNAKERGTRALDSLRGGVEQAIQALGEGFLAHPGNTALKEELRRGSLGTQDFYREILRLVYRLIFLFAAEDRGLLCAKEAGPEAKMLYQQYYSAGRLRRLAERRRGTRHPDLYRSLKMVMQHLGADGGCPELGLPALGSYLWSKESVAHLAEADIFNTYLLSAVRQLAFTLQGNILRAVDYKNLGAEELGSIYESLLELHPKVDANAAQFELATAAGHERKTTGSYYTPSSLILCLLNSALDPVLERAAKSKEPEKAILELKVCDPACGSGHFLIAAAHRIAKRLAAVRTGDAEPSPEATRTALRDVIGRCIYGVDINPMSVELCKVGLWLEALVPGKALSFLDHHIQCGNSLIGTTPALIAKGIPDEAFSPLEGDNREMAKALMKRNREERKQKGQRQLFDLTSSSPTAISPALRTELEQIDKAPDDSTEAVRRKAQAYGKVVHSQDFARAKLVADAWCASFVLAKTSGTHITQATIDALKNGETVAQETITSIREAADTFGFLHWHLAFPDAFGDVSSDGSCGKPLGAASGFSVVLGNPPWDVYQPEEERFFAMVAPSILEAKTAAERKRLIRLLQSAKPEVWAAWLRYTDRILRSRDFMSGSGRFPLTSYGKTNLYSSFAELSLDLIAAAGRAGIIVPSGISTDEPNKHFMQAIVDQHRLISLFDFENREGIFPAVHRMVRFCLLSLRGTEPAAATPMEFVFFAHRTDDLRENGRHFSLSAADIALVNPNTRTCPIFRRGRDAELVKGIYHRIPAFQVEGAPAGDPWGLRLSRLFMMDSDSSLFVPLEAEKNIGKLSRLYEAKLIHHFDHRFATFEGVSLHDLRGGQAAPMSQKDPGNLVLPRFYVPTTDVESRYRRSSWDQSWALALRDITSSANERTVITCFIPRDGAANNLPLIQTSQGAKKMACLCANLNSFSLDYIARQKVGGSHINFYLLQQFPAIQPTVYDAPSPFERDTLLRDWISRRVLELSYTATDLLPLAVALGFEGPPFAWASDRRFRLCCELDAAFFHLYGIAQDDVDYVMETFPIVKKNDEKEHGDYRTKRLILDIYDEMKRAMETGMPYKTRLTPPPGDIGATHGGGKA